MIRFWSGLYLLSASWVFGTGYYYAPQWLIWSVCVVAGVLLVASSDINPAGAMPPPGDPASATNGKGPHSMATVLWAAALLPAVIVAPWPHRVAPLVGMLGWLIHAWLGGQPQARRLAGSLAVAGLVLGLQDVALLVYRSWTARSHELPGPFAWCIEQMGHLLDVEIGRTGSNLLLPTMRETHALGGTWELLLDPATLAFLCGGLVLVVLTAANRPTTSAAVVAPAPVPAAKLSRSAVRRADRKPQPPRPPSRRWALPAAWRPVTVWLSTAAVWMILRAGLLIGLALHRALLTDYDAPLKLASQFWNPWLLLVLLLPLAALHAWSLGQRSGPDAGFAAARGWTGYASLRRPMLLGAGAVAALTLAVVCEPIGERKPGRIAVDEFHSKWEPTQRPFDTEWYGHLSGYNYASIYDYCSRFYDMSRLTNALDDAALANLDVLVLKVPTEPYGLEEIGSVVRFVERGGGVLLVGEHTDVFGTGWNLNAIARRFGFEFRYDCLFGIDTFFDQYFVPSFVPHPVVQHMRDMDFATSCSIQPLGLSGHGVITSTGLKNSLADYHVSNYYPQAVDHAAMRYGAFVQLWAAQRGAGRVLGFTDSTIFSNFCTFEPGKAELMLGMLEWLNHRGRFSSSRALLTVLGLASLLGVVVQLSRKPPAILPVVSVAAGVWAVTAAGWSSWQRHAMPPPPAKRPFVEVTFDRTVSDSVLPKNGFIDGRPNGFGIFERWVLRLGYFNRREGGLPALSGDLVVFPYPDRPVPIGFRDALVRYVEAGGRALVLDSPLNTNSTASALLAPFQLSQKPGPKAPGTLTGPAGFPVIPLEIANEIVGGHPVVTADGKPVAATVRHGKGTVTVVGFGSTFTDAKMGVTGDVEPNADLRQVFDFEFALIRAIVGDKLLP